MNLKNNKAFTLIELLAVIVILAVVALVATPIIIASVENAKKSAASSSALGYIDSLNSSLELNSFDNDLVLNKTYTFNQIETLKGEGQIFNKTDVQGDKPTEGIFYFDDNKVSSANICVNGYNVVYNGNKTKVLGKCGTLYKENLLNGADPVYSSNLIPVVIENDGKVKKANIYDAKNPWYHYGNKKWANAIILKNNKADEYFDKAYGTEIVQSDIESYFVWIPKYSYQLFAVEQKTNTGSQLIDIEFGTNNTSDDVTGECTTPMTSGNIGNCEVGEKMTHPAFLSMDTNGFWVGKFEPSSDSNSRINVLPNVSSLRSINLKSMFELAYNYSRDNDSHMMKNTEWGAVAYLSHSNYGIGNTEVRINNRGGYLTGYSAVTAPTCSGGSSRDCNQFGTSNTITKPYNDSTTGYLASTTGNITGIYDMSGGSFEYVVAYIDNYFKKSGFSAETICNYDSKYFDVYSSTNDVHGYSKMILGDATGELIDSSGKNWYDDHKEFLNSDRPWLNRSGLYNDGSVGGIFNFYHSTGEAWGGGTFRLVINH